MTEAEYAAALLAEKNSIKAYINSTDPAKVTVTLQILVSTMITNAGNSNPIDILTNFTNIHATLDQSLGSP